MQQNILYRAPLLLAAVSLFTVGCGEQASQEELFAALNLEAPPCTATFTEEYEVKDTWDDSLFTASIGDKFIVASISDWGGDTIAELYYLTSEGAYGFDIETAGTDVSALPFELSCAIGESESRLGAFNTVTVYSDEELTQQACTLERGSSAIVGVASGYRLVSDLFSEPMIYEVELGGFSQECGVGQGYMEAESTRVFGTFTSLIPIMRYQTAAN